MAFAVHFRFQWESRNGNDYRIDILENNYSGSIIKRPLGGAPQLRRDKNGAVCGTSLEFLAQAQEDGEFAVLYTSNPQAFRVDLYQNSTLTWQGFVTPELYSEPYIAPPYNVRVTATDNLGELKLSDYTAQGRVTISSLLTYILNKTGLTFSVHWLSAMHPSAATNVTAANMPTSTQINVDHMEGETLYDVLTKVLNTFNAFIVQHGCSWLIVRETDLEALRSSATITAPDGSTYAIADFGSMVNRTWWPVGFLSQSVVPAKKKKVITAPNNWIENLLPKTATSSTNATYYDSEDGDTPYYELVPWNGSQQYSQASVAFWSPSSEFVPVKDLNLSLVIQTFGVLAGHTYGKKCAAVTVRIVGSDGNNYIYSWLGQDGNLTTTMVEALPIYAVGQDAPEQHNLVIPIASQMSTIGFTKIYQIQVEIKSTDTEDGISRMRVYGWTCNIPEQNQGYQVTCILNNGARGEDGETEIVAADNTNKNLETVFVTNGLKYTAAQGGAPIAKWASENISSLSLLEFLARDYSLGIAVPRLRMEGIINVPLNASLPLLFRGGDSDINNSLIFWPEKWDWNLVDDALDIAMVSLPAASVQVTSVTRTAQGSDGMVISSGGSAPSGGGGGGGSTGTVTSVGLVMPTQFQVTGSPVTTAGNLTVTLKSDYVIPTDQQTRYWYAAYDWGNHALAGYLKNITSAMVISALGFTPTDNAGTVTSVKMTVPTGLSVSGSPITSSGTLAVSLASGYTIPLSADVQKGVSAYGWGDHSQAGYALSASINNITGVSWSDGTTSGPTISLSRSSGNALTSAIPAAASNKSGVVTTGTQTFAGEKTFTGNVNVSGKMKAAILAIPTTAPSSDTDWVISIDTSAISGGVV